jgi:putative ABC transport system ATP-binding protein
MTEITTDRPAVLTMHAVQRIHGRGTTAVTALAGVHLTVSAGELVALMGPSGSGKSTLLHVAGGLDRPDAGDVVVDGVGLGRLDLTRLAALRRRSVGYVFQELNLLTTLTIEENVALPLELDGIPRRRARRAAAEALERVGLTAQQGQRYPDDVSGGQRQRAAVARAIVGRRRLLLADEPTGALDTGSGDEVMGVMRSLADTGTAVVVVTHDARLAAWADRVLFMRDGRIVDSTADPAVRAPRGTTWPPTDLPEVDLDEDDGPVPRGRTVVRADRDGAPA